MCLKAQLRVVAEHVNRRLKIFRILAERYRNRRKRFGLRFNLIAAILNFELATPSWFTQEVYSFCVEYPVLPVIQQW